MNRCVRCVGDKTHMREGVLISSYVSYERDKVYVRLFSCRIYIYCVNYCVYYLIIISVSYIGDGLYAVCVRRLKYA